MMLLALGSGESDRFSFFEIARENKRHNHHLRVLNLPHRKLYGTMQTSRRLST